MEQLHQRSTALKRHFPRRGWTLGGQAEMGWIRIHIRSSTPRGPISSYAVHHCNRPPLLHRERTGPRDTSNHTVDEGSPRLGLPADPRERSGLAHSSQRNRFLHSEIVRDGCLHVIWVLEGLKIAVNRWHGRGNWSHRKDSLSHAKSLEPTRGFEPPTCALRVRCSTS